MISAVGQSALVAPGAEALRPGAQAQAAAPAGVSFQSVLNDAVKNVASDLNASEVAARGALTGTTGTREVVDAIMKAERSVQTAIAIRDKLVSGYHELSRMQI